MSATGAKLSRDERDQVVELLRCAVDGNGIAGTFEALYGIDTTGAHYQPGGRSNYPIWDTAVLAWEAVAAELASTDYDMTCLEVAQRIEEGSWP